jgi:hypothetical protein
MARRWADDIPHGVVDQGLGSAAMLGPAGVHARFDGSFSGNVSQRCRIVATPAEPHPLRRRDNLHSEEVPGCHESEWVPTGSAVAQVG